MTETILIVDDEESIRKTFAEWLHGSGWPIAILTAADAEAALRLANQQAIDLAILDWNLGSGSDGLRLLEDLTEFQPDLTAILVTGYAAQATPLTALRCGVRDYLEKNQNLTRESFLAAIRKQLDAIIPAKRQRHLSANLKTFRDAVEQAIPLVRDREAFHDPLPLPQAVRSLVRFAVRGTSATAGVLIVHHVDGNCETVRAFDADGQALGVPSIPFGRTIAANVLGDTKPQLLANFATDASLKLFPFEESHATVLAVPMAVRPGTRAVLELFGKAQFEADDIALAALVAEIGIDLLRHALAERQSQRLLFDAMESALHAGDRVADTMTGTASIIDSVRQSLPNNESDDGPVLDLIAAVRTLSVKHGEPALAHTLTLVRELQTLLDAVAG